MSRYVLQNNDSKFTFFFLLRFSCIATLQSDTKNFINLRKRMIGISTFYHPRINFSPYFTMNYFIMFIDILQVEKLQSTPRKPRKAPRHWIASLRSQWRPPRTTRQPSRLHSHTSALTGTTRQFPNRLHSSFVYQPAQGRVLSLLATGLLR
jgi:hypothetical protein